MFLPSEAVYAELHANFTGLVEEAYKARVWIVSPTTMMATLNTVRAVLKDVRMREQAGEIQKTVGLLLGDVKRLDERVEQLKTHFAQTEKDLRDDRHLRRPHHQARPAHPRRRSRRGAGAALAEESLPFTENGHVGSSWGRVTPVARP